MKTLGVPPPRFMSASRFMLPGGAASVYLDALRGIAAFGVLVHHWQDVFSFGAPSDFKRFSFNYWLHALLGLGHQWVVVFFVMSGYLVGGTVLRSVAQGRWSLGKYALTRGTRLYIVLIPALILGALVDWSGIHLLHAAAPLYRGQAGVLSVHFDVASRLHLSTFVGNALFLQTIHLPFTAHAIQTFGSNGPLWSLAYEFWFYVGFPLLVFTLKPATKLSTRLICLGSLILWVLFTGPAISLLWLIWLMGVALHFLPRLPVLHTNFGLASVSFILLSSVVVLKAVHPYNEAAGGVYWTDFVFGIVVTAFLYSLIHWKGHAMPASAESVAKHAASSSYTLYLVHLPALIFLRGWLQPPGAGQPAAFELWPSLLAVLVVFAYAQMVYYLFERNTVRVRNWLGDIRWKEMLEIAESFQAGRSHERLVTRAIAEETKTTGIRMPPRSETVASIGPAAKRLE
jgi:peptidoglycan/LPS O-acetylase OafA/YrhL